MIKNCKQLCKNIRKDRDGISAAQLAKKINKMYDNMIHDAARQSGIDLRRSAQ